MSGNNTFSGGLTLNAGTLNINNGTAIGTGTFTLNGGTIDVPGGDITFTNNNPEVWATDFQFIGTHNLNTGTGAIVLNTNPTINVQASTSTLTIGGAIANGTGNSITKAGPGLLILNGASSYTGTTNINAGTVLVNNSNSLGSPPGGAVTILSGAVLDVGGSGTANGINFGQKQFIISGDGITPNGGTISGR